VALLALAAVPADQRDVVRVAAVAAPIDQIAVTDPDELLVDLMPRLRPNTRSLAAARLAGHALVVRDSQPIAVITPADFARAIQLAKLTPPPPTPPLDDDLPRLTPRAPVAGKPRDLVS
jgi:hypothetical protein